MLFAPSVDAGSGTVGARAAQRESVGAGKPGVGPARCAALGELVWTARGQTVAWGGEGS